MRKSVIGDIHFGVKSNSLFWLETQLELFDKQIFDIIENKNIEQVIFLGDVSDIRYSINQQIGIEIRDLFRKMLDKFSDKQFIICAGNHDYQERGGEYYGPGRRQQYCRLPYQAGQPHADSHVNQKEPAQRQISVGNHRRRLSPGVLAHQSAHRLGRQYR